MLCGKNHERVTMAEYMAAAEMRVKDEFAKRVLELWVMGVEVNM